MLRGLATAVPPTHIDSSNLSPSGGMKGTRDDEKGWQEGRHGHASRDRTGASGVGSISDGAARKGCIGMSTD